MSSIKQWKSLTLQLNRIFDELPSTIERDEMLESINRLNLFLDELGKSLSALPTKDEASRARESLVKLEHILNSNPLLRTYTSGGKKSHIRTTKNNSSIKPPQVTFNIALDLERYVAMSEADLRQELSDPKKISNNMLRAILTYLGRKITSKSTRKDMSEQLIVAIVNQRTYQGLRGEQENITPA